MTGTTTGQLALLTATDSDDAENYLTASLTTDLQTLANLFDSSTGHDHAGSGKGKPIASAGIASGITLTSPQLTSPVVTSGGLTVNAGGSHIVAGGVTIDAGGIALAAGGLTLTQAAGNSLMPPQPNSSACFALDMSGNGPNTTIANTSAYGPFGATNNFGGLLIVHNVTNSDVGVFVIGSIPILVASSLGTYSVTALTASKTNIYLTSGSVTVENRMGSSQDYRFLGIRTRATA